MNANHVARVATAKIPAEMIGPGRTLWEQRIIPAMKAAPGFRHVYVLGDDKSGTVMTISLWDSEAQAEAWEQCEAHKTMRGHLGSLMKSVPTPDTFHVKLES
jgi:heme-degrading monooxygenase HmoA